MAGNGHGSARIVLVPRQREARPAPVSAPEEIVAHDARASAPQDVWASELGDVWASELGDVWASELGDAWASAQGEIVARDPRMTAPQPAPRSSPPAVRGGWTVRRLMIGASLGGTATLIGGILFKDNFTLLTGSRGPILAVSFGLFIIGLIAFFGCLIGLAAVAIRSFAGRHGWGRTALVALAPAVLVYGLFGLGAYGPMYPALFTLLAAGGFIIACSHR